MAANIIELFGDEWDRQPPADIIAFLAAHTPGFGDLVPIIVLDIHRRWKTPDPLMVEQYFEIAPQLSSDPSSRLKLAIAEFSARRAANDKVDVQDYAERFADIATTLRSRLESLVDSSVDSSGTKSLGPQPEQRIGRYLILSPYAEGGFGTVFLAYDEELKRSVAIKLPRADRTLDSEAFLVEAQTLARLDHPNIVTVYDCGEHEGLVYLVCKFIEGANLRYLLSQTTPGLTEKMGLIVTVARALDFAHQAGFIHRDIKPENILVDVKGTTAYVSDFGLAVQNAVTENVKSAGTPAYMSPEQTLGPPHALDGRSDIFSLGVVIYELITGRRPFAAKERSQLFEMIRTQNPEPPKQLNPKISEQLSRLCLKALAKDATRRYSSAVEMANELEQLIHNNEIFAPGEVSFQPPKIFVSYCSQDRKWANRTRKALDNLGIECCEHERAGFDEESQEDFKTSLKDQSHLLVIVSVHAMKTRWVEFECEAANQLGKEVIAIRLDDTDTHGMIPDGVSEVKPDENQSIKRGLIHALSLSPKIAASGVVPYKFVKACGRFGNEEFLSEILESSIRLVRRDNRVEVHVYRGDVSNAVISSAGKRLLSSKLKLETSQEDLAKLESRIHHFISGDTEQPIEIPSLPFRWSSGGLIPIANYQPIGQDHARDYVVLLYRDIPPHGWNVALGASQRGFHVDGTPDNQLLDRELTKPWWLMIREFLEEILIVDSEPTLLGTVSWKRFKFPWMRVGKAKKLARQFTRSHRELRDRDDQLTISESEDRVEANVLNDTSIDLHIHSQPGEAPTRENNVLIAITPQELGIEVVKVVKFKLGRHDYILDGEIFEPKQKLVRMPVGLISLDYIKSAFGSQWDISQSTCYPTTLAREKNQPSIQGPPISSDDFHIFRWDIDQRERVQGDDAFERERFGSWSDQFAETFNGTGEVPSFFTPATAKLLSYLNLE